jgi:hypothetical protein
VTDAERCAEEIADLHRVFERVLGAGEDDAGRFEAAFADSFGMVMPNGKRLTRAEVLAFLRAARGTRGADFRIAIEDVAVLHAAAPLFLMHYVERQWLHGTETTRRAVALFDATAAPRWLFVQETWVKPPGNSNGPYD